VRLKWWFVNRNLLETCLLLGTSREVKLSDVVTEGIDDCALVFINEEGYTNSCLLL
jgi:hypothetical protein